MTEVKQPLGREKEDILVVVTVSEFGPPASRGAVV